MKRSALAIAPMMAWTDRHYRAFIRCWMPGVEVYTEMVTTAALVFGPHERLLREAKPESTILQLGGSDAKQCEQAAGLAVAYGYRHINLNVGCPSSRVQKGKIGACLLEEPELVRECLLAMKAVDPTLRLSVKTRIGLGEVADSWQLLLRFMQLVTPVCDAIVLHAREAWLHGLNPKANRAVPPLNYPRVYELQAAFPKVPVTINGGIVNWQAAKQLQADFGQIMVGRLAISKLDQVYAWAALLGDEVKAVDQAWQDYQDYLKQQQGQDLRYALKPLLLTLSGAKLARRLRGEIATAMQQRHLPIEQLSGCWHSAVCAQMQKAINQGVVQP